MSTSVLQRQVVHKEAPPPSANSIGGRDHAAEAQAARVEGPPPTLRPEHKGHIQFYGFYLNREWMMKFAAAHRPGNKPPKFISTVAWFIEYLRDHSAFQHIGLEGALIDKDTPSEATVVEGYTGVRQISVITLCVWEKRSWERRPTKEQVEIISNIMGIKPQWFSDVNPFALYLQ